MSLVGEGELTDSWVEWARTLSCATDAHAQCCVEEQDPLRKLDEQRWMKIVQPGLRWPGYLGTAYEPGGILSIGIVHTDFATAGLRDSHEVPKAVQGHQAWSEGAVDNAPWLRGLTSMYRQGLSWPGGWSVAKHHSYYWKELGESVDSIAYVNAMRCQWPGSKPSDSVVRRCISALPLDRVVALLRPRLVIANAKPAFDQLQGTTAVLYVHQLNGRNLERVAVGGPTGSVTVGLGNREETVECLRAAGLARHQPPRSAPA